MQYVFLSFFLFFSFQSLGNFYSIDTGKLTNKDSLLTQYDLLIFTSKDCPACHLLLRELKKCSTPKIFKIAIIISERLNISDLENKFDFFMTSSSVIKQETNLTPISYLRKKIFKKGFFTCKELLLNV